MACCGSGGPPYNYRPGKAACGSPKVTACADGGRRISWDGLHYTEAANRVVADEVLSAEHSVPPLRLQTLCTSPT
jgi:phospholipase/lecithinase/hemolysin